MNKVEFGLRFKNAQLLESKKGDWWIWVIGIIVMILGVALIAICVWLLCKSYSDGNPLAAYAGGIGSGLAVVFAGITQLLLSIHRKRDSEEEKYLRTEHDYTNFFVKNIECNERVLIVLSRAYEACNIDMVYKNEKIILSYCVGNPNATINDLCSKYIYEIVYTIVSRDDFREPITKSYSIPTKAAGNYIFDAFLSCFDTEIKKTIYSIEKMLQKKYFRFYDNKFFSYNMENSLNKYVKMILSYLLIITRGSNLYGSINEIVELAPFTLYYYSKLGEK